MISKEVGKGELQRALAQVARPEAAAKAAKVARHARAQQREGVGDAGVGRRFDLDGAALRRVLFVFFF